MNSTTSSAFPINSWVVWTLTRPVYGLRGRTEVRGKVVRAWDQYLTLEVHTDRGLHKYIVLAANCKPAD